MDRKWVIVIAVLAAMFSGTARALPKSFNEELIANAEEATARAFNGVEPAVAYFQRKLSGLMDKSAAKMVFQQCIGDLNDGVKTNLLKCGILLLDSGAFSTAKDVMYSAKEAYASCASNGLWVRAGITVYEAAKDAIKPLGSSLDEAYNLVQML